MYLQYNNNMVMKNGEKKKLPNTKWAGGVAQEVEYLPSNCEAQSLNHNKSKINK
jgi:hypothetical protein